MSLVTPKKAIIESKFWQTGVVLDQGDTPQCVAFAWSQFLQTAPIETALPSLDYPAALYASAQQLDEFSGEDYDGTSVRGGVKALQAQGRIANYVWSHSADEVRRFILTHGIVVMGTDWYDAMFEPDSKHFIKPRGQIAGGHAWLLTGYSQKQRAFRMINSWGTSWGDRGHAWIRFDDLKFLLRRPDAEACAAIEQSIIPLPPQ